MKRACKTGLAAGALLLATLAGVDAAHADETGLVAEGAKPKKLAGDFKFTEGPASDKNGDVYFSDIPNNRIHKWDAAEQKLSTFAENSGGSNGLYFDAKGRLIGCLGKARQVAAFSDDGKRTAIVEKYEGKRFNSPNDLWIHPNGGIYFTDPRYGSQDDRDIDGFHVYYIAPDRKTVTRVLDDLTKPNGLIGTPDGKTLYVADPGARTTYRYSIGDDGSLSGKKLFCKSGSDGMTLDEKGNVYLTSGAVLVFNPDGKQIAAIKFPEGPANVTFGGKDRKTLFVTARTGFYSLQMAVKGME